MCLHFVRSTRGVLAPWSLPAACYRPMERGSLPDTHFICVLVISHIKEKTFFPLCHLNSACSCNNVMLPLRGMLEELILQ